MTSFPVYNLFYIIILNKEKRINMNALEISDFYMKL